MPHDLSRMAKALSRPGIDPRSFVALALVRSVNVTDRGVYCDVLIIPDQIEETATLSPTYAGSNFGLYAPIQVGDQVVVGVPDGDPNHGLRIIGRTWDGGERPPSEVVDNPADFILVVKEGNHCRFITKGGGNAIVQVEGSGKVLLGNQSAVLQVARVSDAVQVTIPAGMVIVPNPVPPPDTIANPIDIVLSGVIVSGSDKVRST